MTNSRFTIGRPLAWAAMLVPLLTGVVRATSLQYAGVVGNSGESGTSLIRGSEIRGGGVVVDHAGRVYASTGDRIVVTNADGRRLWDIHPPDEQWIIGGQNLVIHDGSVWFIAGRPYQRVGGFHLRFYPPALVYPNICRAPARPGVHASVVVTTRQLAWLNPSAHGRIILAANARRLLVGLSLPREHRFRVSELKNETITTLFEIDGRGGGMNIDDSDTVWLGAGGMVRKFDLNGTPVAGFEPVTMPSLGPVPSDYSGMVMLTRDVMWDYGHYGFLGRFTRDIEPAPGAVSRWMHALAQVMQITDAPNGNYYIQSQDALYLAAIDAGQLVLRRRFGCIPHAHALVVTANGYIGVGSPSRHGMLWFDFDNSDPAAAPVRAEYGGPASQGYAGGDVAYALGVVPAYLNLDHSPPPARFQLKRYRPEPFVHDRNQSEPIPRAFFEHQTPIVGIARIDRELFGIANGTLLRAPLTDTDEWQLVGPMPGATSIAAVGRLLLVAQSGAVHAYEVQADRALAERWRLTAAAAHAPFSEKLHIAAADSLLLVADTNRHRVTLHQVPAALEQPGPAVASFGEVDQAGDSTGHLTAPTLVAIQNGRAVVYDSHNARVVKLRVR